jgi:hypothetical protein
LKATTSTKNFKTWLDKLQWESWQMELLISGFSIVLLLKAVEQADVFSGYLSVNAISGDNVIMILGIMGFAILASVYILLINLIIHIILRGLWIATVGLRSLSNKISYSRLGYSERFHKYLLRKTGSYDSYVARLEGACSSIFAFSFLLAFVVIATILSLAFTLMVLLVSFYFNKENPFSGSEIVGGISALIVLVLIIPTQLLYLFDFLTLGGLKRIKWRWFSRLYLPIYRFYSALTLAPVYRPLLYNMLSNRFSKRLVLLAIPYLILITVLSTFFLDGHPYFPVFHYHKATPTAYLHTNFYDDERKPDTPIKIASLPTRYVSNGFLEVFLLYDPNDNELIEHTLADSLKRYSGLNSELTAINLSNQNEQLYLERVSGLFKLQVNDSVYRPHQPLWYTHSNMEEKGLLQVLDVSYLPRGRHTLHLYKVDEHSRREEADSVQYIHYQLPFWKE